MERSWYWRLAVVIAVILGGLYVSMPSFIYLTSSAAVRRDANALKDAIPDVFPESRLSLGIDLQGGLHLVMGVDTEKAVFNRVDCVADEIAGEMKDKGHPVTTARRNDAGAIEIVMKDPGDWATLKPVLDARGDNWVATGPSGSAVKYEMREQRVKQLKTDAVTQVIKTLRTRIDKYGVAEPEVRMRGDDAVLIQLAGLTADQERNVKEEVIGRTAQLEFKLVDDESKYFTEISSRAGEGSKIKLSKDTYRGPGDVIVASPYLYAPTKEELTVFVNANPPPSDRMVSYSKFQSDEGERVRTWLLDRKTPLTGDSIVNAQVSLNRDENQPYVALTLDRAGGVVFDQLTAANIKKRVAIVLEDEVNSAPVIQSRIPSGNVSITVGGYKSQEEVLKDANGLAMVLNAGALPAPVYPQEERTVGATLGDDAIAKGNRALIASVVIVVLVMLIYYKLSGAIAIIAMAVNMLLLFAVLAGLRGTLTLPGLAGLALSVGMAVDANIVQFERIREELRLGKTIRGAIEAGFEKAFSAVFDSHVTTILSAIVLLQYGSGPIRGFAVTLLIGTPINLFTAIMIPRLALEYLARGRKVQALSI